MENKKIQYLNLLEKFIENEKNFIKKSTLGTYFSLIKNHIEPYFNDILAEEVDSKKVQEFIFYMLNKKKKKGSGKMALKSIKDTVSIVQSSINFGIKKQLINTRVLEYKYPIIEKNREIKIFILEEQKKILNYYINNSNIKNIGIILSLFLGLRIGEVCGLKWENVDLKNKVITINKTVQRIYQLNKKSKVIMSTPKTKKSDRIIPINEFVVDNLKKFKKSKGKYILTGGNTPIEPKVYREYYYKILKKLNIEKKPFHSLRHTFATFSVESGIDYKIISEILGHSSIKTTLELYVHPQLEHKRQCIEILFQKINN